MNLPAVEFLSILAVKEDQVQSIAKLQLPFGYLDGSWWALYLVAITENRSSRGHPGTHLEKLPNVR